MAKKKKARDPYAGISGTEVRKRLPDAPSVSKEMALRVADRLDLNTMQRDLVEHEAYEALRDHQLSAEKQRKRIQSLEVALEKQKQETARLSGMLREHTKK